MATPYGDSLSGDWGFLNELRMRAAVTPAEIALIEPGRDSLTFAGLQNRIRRVARAVMGAGITCEDVVALALPDGAGLMTSFLGIASVGHCAVLNPTLRQAEIESVLADLEAHALIVDSTLFPAAQDAARRCGIALLNLASWDACPEQTFSEESRGGHPALFLHTSATTGKARIVPLTHSNLRAMAASTSAILNLTSADRFLSMMPLFHLQGLLSSLAQMLAGGTVICTAGFEAGAFLSWLEDYRPT